MAKTPKHKSSTKQAKPARERTGVGPVKADAVYQLRIVLRRSKPPIWRRLLVRSDTTLTELHLAIQIAFGWTNSHLHEFCIGPGQGTRYQAPPPEEFEDLLEADVEDANLFDLKRLRLAPKSKFAYTYDFGDGWVHDVLVEKVLSTDAAELLLTESQGLKFTRATRTPIAFCIAGARSGPVEDCGGIWGWADLCDIMADPSHPEHEERKDWVGDYATGSDGKNGFDPARFELKPVNDWLKKYVKR